jgi:nitroreductase
LALDTFRRLAATRRSNLRIDVDRPVSDELVKQLCELIHLAPNHHRTSPWRIAVFTGPARERLGAIVEATGVKRSSRKYLRAPVIVVVGADDHDEPVVSAENRDAAAAGIQNMLLGATAAGLASLWSTGKTARSAELPALAGFAPAVTIVGLVYLGWPASEPAAALPKAVDVLWYR